MQRKKIATQTAFIATRLVSPPHRRRPKPFALSPVVAAVARGRRPPHRPVVAKAPSHRHRLVRRSEMSRVVMNCRECRDFETRQFDHATAPPPSYPPSHCRIAEPPHRRTAIMSATSPRTAAPCLDVLSPLVRYNGLY